jgi:hypothetical protein
MAGNKNLCLGSTLTSGSSSNRGKKLKSESEASKGKKEIGYNRGRELVLLMYATKK